MPKFNFMLIWKLTFISVGSGEGNLSLPSLPGDTSMSPVTFSFQHLTMLFFFHGPYYNKLNYFSVLNALIEMDFHIMKLPHFLSFLLEVQTHTQEFLVLSQDFLLYERQHAKCSLGIVTFSPALFHQHCLLSLSRFGFKLDFLFSEFNIWIFYSIFFILIITFLLFIYLGLGNFKKSCFKVSFRFYKILCSSFLVLSEA